MARLNFACFTFSDVVPVVSHDELSTWANERTVAAYRMREESNLIVFSSDTTPFTEPENSLCRDFWRLARGLDSYESLLATLSEYRPLGFKYALFPIGTRRRKVMFKFVSFIRRYL